VVAAAAVGATSLFTVEPGYRGIMFDRARGILPQSYKEGTHFRVPLLQEVVHYMDCRVRAHEVPTETGTKDLQNVKLTLRLLYRPDPTRAPEIYRKLGSDFGERVLPSVSNEVLKSVVALYDAEELLTKRDQVSKQIRTDLTQRCSSFNILIDDVALTTLTFSPDFVKAIEDKQVAEQNAERAKYVVAKAEQEKKALIIRSEGDAEAAKMVSDALKKSGRGLLEIRRLETALFVADALSHAPYVTYLPNHTRPLLALPADK